MDGVPALALASDVVQFVSFASDLLNMTVEIHQSPTGTTNDVITLESLYSALDDINTRMQESYTNSSYYIQGFGSAVTVRDVTFRTLTTLCQSDCQKLLEVVTSLRVESGPGRPWRSFRSALKTVWEKKEIEYLEERLHRTQTTMTLHVCTIASYAQQTHQAKLEKIQAECKQLQIKQSKQLHILQSNLQQLSQTIGQVHTQNFNQIPSPGDIAALEQDLFSVSAGQRSIQDAQKILRTLSFKGRQNRPTSIPTAYKETFRWVYEPAETVDESSSVSHLSKWLSCKGGIFWLSGKPGSGKSTLMKFVAEDPRTLDLLGQWSGSKKVTVARHYFWSAGSAMQKSEEGLLRSLLYEVFRCHFDLVNEFFGDRRADEEEEQEDGLLPWTVPDLRRFLNKLATQDMSDERFCFFIDGLDECISDQAELCEMLTSLASWPHIKICLSSRSLNVFEEAFGEDPQLKLYIQDLTRTDILKYTRHRLESHPRWKFLSAKKMDCDWLIEEVERRACGVFLWVFLVTRVLRESLTNRDNFSELRRRLQFIPEELEDFFQQILSSVEPFYHEQMSTLLYLAIDAKEPLHAVSYYFHDLYYSDKSFVFDLPVQPFDESERKEIVEDTIWRLNSRTRGLLELHRQSQTVTFLHRTVKDFLSDQRWSGFLASKAPKDFSSPLFMLKIYIAMIKRGSFDNLATQQGSTMFDNTHLEHLTAEALMHAQQVERNATPIATGGGSSSSSRRQVFELLKDLDNALLVKFSLKQASYTAGPPESFLRKQLIIGQHIDFLAWIMPTNSTYLSRLGPSLVLSILATDSSNSNSSGNIIKGAWRSEGIRLLVAVLNSQKLDMNKAQWHSDMRRVWTPWTLLVGYATSWSRQSTDSTVEERFWLLLENNVLSLMLKCGADPNTTVWSDHMEACPAVAAFLDLAFEMNPDLGRRDAMYLQTINDFFSAGASLDRTHTEFSRYTIQLKFGGSAKFSPTMTKFFTRLNHLRVAELPDRNIELLARVVDDLLSWISPRATQVLVLNRNVVERFPADIVQRIEAQPGVSWMVVSHR